MTALVQECERFLDRRWILVKEPLMPWWARRAGFCSRCHGLAEANDDIGKWWHIDIEDFRECDDPWSFDDAEAQFMPDDNLRGSIRAALDETKFAPKLKLSATQHGTSCPCTVCKLMAEPGRQVPGSLGEIFVTSDEYMKIKNETMDAMSFSGHLPGCDCRRCDRGY